MLGMVDRGWCWGLGMGMVDVGRLMKEGKEGREGMAGL